MFISEIQKRQLGGSPFAKCKEVTSGDAVGVLRRPLERRFPFNLNHKTGSRKKMAHPYIAPKPPNPEGHSILSTSKKRGYQNEGANGFHPTGATAASHKKWMVRRVISW